LDETVQGRYGEGGIEFSKMSMTEHKIVQLGLKKILETVFGRVQFPFLSYTENALYLNLTF